MLLLRKALQMEATQRVDGSSAEGAGAYRENQEMIWGCAHEFRGVMVD